MMSSKEAAQDMSQSAVRTPDKVSDGGKIPATPKTSTSNGDSINNNNNTTPKSAQANFMSFASCLSLSNDSGFKSEQNASPSSSGSSVVSNDANEPKPDLSTSLNKQVSHSSDESVPVMIDFPEESGKLSLQIKPIPIKVFNGLEKKQPTDGADANNNSNHTNGDSIGMFKPSGAVFKSINSVNKLLGVECSTATQATSTVSPVLNSSSDHETLLQAVAKSDYSTSSLSSMPSNSGSSSLSTSSISSSSASASSSTSSSPLSTPNFNSKNQTLLRTESDESAADQLIKSLVVAGANAGKIMKNKYNKEKKRLKESIELNLVDNINDDDTAAATSKELPVMHAKSIAKLSKTPKSALLEKRRRAVSELLRDEIYPSGKNSVLNK